MHQWRIQDFADGGAKDVMPIRAQFLFHDH